MKMKRPCVLISGRSIARDKKLFSALEKVAMVLLNQDNSQIESILSSNQVDLVLIEIFKDNPAEVEIIRELKARFANTLIIFIDGNGDQQLIIKAFSYGAKDAFRKPYKRQLLVDRLCALLSGTI